MLHEFRGKRYRVVRKSLDEGTHGLTTSPDTPEPTLLVDSKLRGRTRLETEIHEALHACFWDMSEEAVDETANSLALFLWKIGYRLDA